jgi:hypothetical protein
MLELSSDVDPDLDDLFATWCDHHHREVVALPGVLRARRYLRVDGQPGLGRYLTVYDLASVAVLDTPAFTDHGRTGTPMPDALAPSLAYQRTVAALVGRAGDTSGAEVVVRATTVGIPEGAAAFAAGLVAPLSGEGGVIGARVYRVEGEPASTWLVLLDCSGSGDELRAVMTTRPWREAAAYRRVFDRSAPSSPPTGNRG